MCFCIIFSLIRSFSDTLQKKNWTIFDEKSSQTSSTICFSKFTFSFNSLLHEIIQQSIHYSHCLSKEDQNVFIAIPNTKGQRVMSHKRAKKSDSEVIHSFGQEKLASIADDAGGKFEREKK